MNGSKRTNNHVIQCKGLKFSITRLSVFHTLKIAKGTVLLILEFPHNLAFFPHNRHFRPHNFAQNFHIIFHFFPHPIRWPEESARGDVALLKTFTFTKLSVCETKLSSSERPRQL